MISPQTQFITVCPFEHDVSKPGREIATAKIGDVYMSRVEIDPDVTSGGYYHKETEVVLYAAHGIVQATFEQVCTQKQKTFILDTTRHVVVVPPYNKITTKNIGDEQAVLVSFSNQPLRSDDSFVHAPQGNESTEEIDVLGFEEDSSVPGRILSTAKVGLVYMTRIRMQPGKVMGNFFHKETSRMFYVGVGSVHCRFEQSVTQERDEFDLVPGSKAVQIPPGVAFQMENTGSTSAVVVVFSNRRLNTGDEHPYSLDW